jgi:hypothetical protein
MTAFGAHRITTIMERSADADLLRRAARLDSRLDAPPARRGGSVLLRTDLSENFAGSQA